MPATITKRMEFDYGHRLLRHESKCRNVHGHRLIVEITCSAEALDNVGRVIDFSKVKDIVGTWIDESFDHGFLAEKGDPIIDFLKKAKSKVYVMDSAPTIENIVELIFKSATNLLSPYKVSVVKVRAYETPNSFADFPA